MALGKEAPKGNPGLAIDLSVGRVAHISDAWGPLCEYGETLKTPCGLTHLVEELHRATAAEKGILGLCRGPS